MKLFDQWLCIPTSSQYTFEDFEDSGDPINIKGMLKKGDIVRPLKEDSIGDRKVGRIDELAIGTSNSRSTDYYTMDIMWNYDTNNSVQEKTTRFLI